MIFAHSGKCGSPSKRFESKWFVDIRGAAAAGSTSSQATLNMDNAWAMWCSDIENYLVQAGLLDSKMPERKVGHVSTAWVPLSQSQKDTSP